MLIYSSSKPNFLHNAGNGGIGSKSAFWAGIKTRHNDLSVACRGRTMKWGRPLLVEIEVSLILTLTCCLGH